MKHRLAIFGLVGVVILTSFAVSGCGRGSTRSIQVLPWDRNVTVVKKPKRKPFKGRHKQVHSRSYNRVRRVPGR